MGIKNWITLGSSEPNLPADKSVVSMDYPAPSPGGMGSVRVLYTLNSVGYEEEPFEQRGYVLFEMPEAGNVTQVGAPMLLQEGLFVAMPQGAVFDSLNVTVKKKQEQPLKAGYRILPVPKPALENEPFEFLEDADYYEKEQIYPGETALYSGTQKLNGIPCAHILICPMEYQASSNKLTLLTSIELEICYHYNEATNSILDSQQMVIHKALKPLVLGYDAIAANPDDSLPDRLLILTNKELAYSLEIYAAKKKFRYRTDIVYIEDILAKKAKMETVAAIHAYLMDEHTKDPISYLILGGDLSVIPARTFSDLIVGKIIDDTYYCRKDGEYVPLFAMSRFPASTREDMNTLAYIATYYPAFHGSNQKKAVFTSYNDDTRGYKQCKLDIKAKVQGSFAITECYDGSATKSELISAINSGSNFINYRGHGDISGWSSSNGIQVSDIAKLNVKNNPPHFLSIACLTNAIYNQNCLGIQLMKKEQAISFLGASAPSYTYTNHDFDKYLWEALETQHLSVIGDVFLWATAMLYKNHPNPQTQTNIQEYLLLGDATADYLEKEKKNG